jgi:IS4 transposase
VIRPSEVEGEFEGLEFGDPRLSRRGGLIASRASRDPGLSFPKMFEDDIELEGFYRFLRNEKVTAERVLAPHVKKSVGRVEEQEGDVLCVHDTTTFTFEGRAQLGIVEGQLRGFLAHCSLAVGVDGTPLGTLGVHTWQRDSNKPTPTQLRKEGHSQQSVREMPSEMDRWGQAILAVEEVVAKPAKLIHVADSESDDYRLLELLQKRACRYVIRGCYDRRIVDDEYTHVKARLLVESPAASRTVNLAPRPRGKTRHSKRNPARQGRVAELEIRAAQVGVQRPAKLSSKHPAELRVNVVHVLEAHPPKGEDPVEWTLFTSESIETEEEILKVVDAYRRRWLIEEFFKALKTGCSYEARQLETFATFEVALGLFIPIAWGLLRLRALERTNCGANADLCFTSDQLAVLRDKSRKPVVTVTDAMATVAQIGGHIRNNGNPGWLVLWRGFRDLLLLAQGVALARRIGMPAYNDQS